jgi:hypothetical protein
MPPDASCTCSTVAPRDSARATSYKRPSVGVRSDSRTESSVSPADRGSVQNPAAAVSVERIALPSASANDRPIAMASPTDFMVVVSSGSAPGNFSNVNRGILTTT